MSKLSGYRIRQARDHDSGPLLHLIRRLAEFEKLKVTTTEASLKQHLFGPQPAAHALLVECGEAPVGFAVYFMNFSTFVGKPGLYVEDVFIEPEHRSRGLGREVFQHLARLAKENECGRMEWTVLDWNARARSFYDNLGAKPLDEWTIYRLDQAGIATLAP